MVFSKLEISTEHAIQRLLSFTPLTLLLVYTLFLDAALSLLVLGATAMGVIVSLLDKETEDVDPYLLFAFLTTSLLLTLILTDYLLTKVTVLFILIWLPISERVAEYIESEIEPLKTSEYVILLFVVTGFFLLMKMMFLVLTVFGESSVVDTTTLVFYDYALVLCSAYFFTSSIYPLVYSYFKETHQKIQSLVPFGVGNVNISRKLIGFIAFVFLVLSFILLPYSSAGRLLHDIGSLESILSIEPIFVFYSSYFTSMYLAPTNITFGIFILLFLYLNPIHSFNDTWLIISLLLVSIGAAIYFTLHLNCPPAYIVTDTPQVWNDNILEWILNDPTRGQVQSQLETCTPDYNPLKYLIKR